MSRTSLKNKAKTTKATASVSRVRKRPVVVFDSAEVKSAHESVLLYRIVFKSKQATILALFFCICFLSQPFQNLYANELDDVQVDVPPEPIITVETVEPIVIEPAVITPEVASPDDEDTTTPEDVIDEELPSEVPEIIESDTNQPVTAPAAEEDVVPESMFESDDLNNETPEEVSETPSEAGDDEAQFVQNLHIISTVNSDSAYSFTKDQCTRIEDGSFYCQERTQTEIIDNSLVAAPDSDGDLEIYLVRDGEQIQITHNDEDDASPYFDEKSKTIVWHRLIDDRYQIISYDTESGEELQLTMGDINNMEPTRQGEYIVWQRWVNDNWEIILYDGSQELQITNSLEHDTAPHVRGPLIIWNSRSFSGEQSLKTYDIENQSFTTIADGEGVSVSNPRMVVMYEAMYENGDVIMKGFDMVTGEIIPLNAIPREMPENIPDTDTTGETRALIQSKPSVRDTVIETTPEPTGTSTPPLPETDLTTLDLRSSTSSDDALVPPAEESEIPILVIPPITS